MAPAKKAKPAIPQGNSQSFSTVSKKACGGLPAPPCFSLSGVCREEAAGKQFELACGSGPPHEVGADLFRMSDFSSLWSLLELTIHTAWITSLPAVFYPPAGGCELTWEAVEEIGSSKQEEKCSPRFLNGRQVLGVEIARLAPKQLSVFPHWLGALDTLLSLPYLLALACHQSSPCQ